MKKIVLAIAAALMMSTGMMAQNEQKSERPERGQFNQTEMVKRRTEQTVQKYGLNEEQAKQLLELNTKYADKMGRPRGGNRGRGMRSNDQRPRQGQGEARPDSTRQRGAQGQNRQMRPRQEEMRKNMEAYDAELQKIMTPEQYEAYKNDMEKQRREFSRDHRQHRSDDNK